MHIVVSFLIILFIGISQIIELMFELLYKILIGIIGVG
nr:MAG TPA: hypothetical protein [Caudoviricetes sp.]